jgi:aminoglycoside/choline kinase family phosphotransferase
MGAGLDLTTASADASFRRYLRVTGGGVTRILMDAPPEQEDCRKFVAIAELLQDAGVHAPEIIARDFEFGYLLLEDFGDETYLQAISDGTRVDDLYADALSVIVKMQGIDTDNPAVPGYSENLLRAELALFPDWFLVHHLAVDVPGWLAKLDDLLVDNALVQPQVFVHRDFHSRNLMQLAHDNPGVLDFQDAVSGPVTYDLVSLSLDAYIEWPDTRVSGWIDAYRDAAVSAGIDCGVDAVEFRHWFDLMGVQRQLKVAGIFARLAHRDGKTRYLADIPRVLGYTRKTCRRHPVLAELGDWLDGIVWPTMRERGMVR